MVCEIRPLLLGVSFTSCGRYTRPPGRFLSTVRVHASKREWKSAPLPEENLRRALYEALPRNEQILELLKDPFLADIEDEDDKENSDAVSPVEKDALLPAKNSKRGRRKGVPMKEEQKLAIKVALKGKNKYKRTEEHRAKVSLAMKKRWVDRKTAGLERKPMRCSVCGQTGHNRQTCPETPPSHKTKHKMPRSFEHRWKIAAGNKRVNSKKREITKKCGYCREPGHSRRNCPKLKALKNASSPNEHPSEITTPPPEKSEPVLPKPFVPHIKTSEVEDLQSLYTVPLDVESMWKLALDCAVIAWRSGVNRQRMEFAFPMIAGGSVDEAMFSSKNDITSKCRVATLIVESVLKGLKSQSGLKGRLDVGVLDDTESAIYWEGKEMAAALFPQPQSLDLMISRGMMRRKKAPGLQLIVNPQWQPGQVISDFGFGSLKTLRENFVNSFEDVFYMKQLSIFSDVVILMRCYPSQWQVHLVEPSGKIELIGTTREKPEYEKILGLLRTAKWSISRLPWIERLKTRYLEGRKQSTLFPLRLTMSEFQTCFKRADSSVAKRVQALNANISDTGFNYPKGNEELRDDESSKEKWKMEEADIITGEVVRDIKMDPIKEFTSLIGMHDFRNVKKDG